MGVCLRTKGTIRDAIPIPLPRKITSFSGKRASKGVFIMKKFTTKQLVLCAVLAAIYVILSYISVGTNNFKVSVESLAILTTAVTMGPIPAFFVGLVGEFIHQLLMYGIDVTTPLWLLPYALEGLLAGFIVKKNLGNLTNKQIIPAIICGEILLTSLVTVVNGISAIVQGWGNWPMIIAGIPLRLGIMAARIVVYILVLPLLYKSLKKVVK